MMITSDQEAQKIPNTNDPLVDHGSYQRLIGKLLVPTVTRHDISFGVNT